LPESFGSGRYEVVRFLGEGGRKRVYLARDAQLQREVAVSAFKTEGMEADALMRARREAEAMGRLGDHQSIVTIYDIGEDDGDLPTHRRAPSRTELASSRRTEGARAGRAQAAGQGSRRPLPDGNCRAGGARGNRLQRATTRRRARGPARPPHERCVPRALAR